MLRRTPPMFLALLLACGDSGGGPSGGADTATGGGAETGASPTGDASGEPTTGSETGGGPTTGSETAGGPTTGDDATGGTTTAEAPPRPGVLIYRGNDGAQPDGEYFRFDILTERLTAAGKTVEDTDVWPSSLAEVGFVVLVINATPFDAGQLADLAEVLAGGGVVLVSNDWSDYAESANLSALLAELGSGLAFEDALLAESGDGVVVNSVEDHPLTAGVASLVVAGGSKVLGCADGRALAMAEGACLLAAEARGSGLLLAFGDTEVFDDHALSMAAEDQNFALLANLVAALP